MGRRGSGQRYTLGSTGPELAPLSQAQREEIERFAGLKRADRSALQLAEHDWLRLELARSDYAALRPLEITDGIVWGGTVAKWARVFVSGNEKRWADAMTRREPGAMILLHLIGGYRRRAAVTALEAARLVIDQHQRDLRSGIVIGNAFNGLVCDLGHVVSRNGGKVSASGGIGRDPAIEIQAPFVRFVWAVMACMPEQLQQRRQASGWGFRSAVNSSLTKVRLHLGQGNFRSLRLTPLDVCPDARIRELDPRFEFASSRKTPAE